MILVINDLTLVSLLLLINLFDRSFLTGILSSCPALRTESYLLVSYYKESILLGSVPIPRGPTMAA